LVKLVTEGAEGNPPTQPPRSRLKKPALWRAKSLAIGGLEISPRGLNGAASFKKHLTALESPSESDPPGKFDAFAQRLR